MLLIHFLIRIIHIRCNICANSCLINVVAIKVRNRRKNFLKNVSFVINIFLKDMLDFYSSVGIVFVFILSHWY